MKDLCKKLHKKLHNKLHNSKGETLLEVLVSILVCTISVALLFSAITAAANINRKAETSDEGFFAVLNSAEEKTEGTHLKKGSVHVTLQGVSQGGNPSTQFDVYYYGNNTIYSYKMVTNKLAGGDSAL